MVSSIPKPQSITARFDGDGVAVIYQPDPKKFSGPIGFGAPAPKGTKKAGELETIQVVLSVGTQFVEFDKWEKIESFEGNKSVLKRLTKRRILTVIKPDVPEEDFPTRTTKDFSDEDDALQLVENSFHLEWLQACFNQETQRPRVREACQGRIQVVRQMVEAKKLPENVFRG